MVLLFLQMYTPLSSGLRTPGQASHPRLVSFSERTIQQLTINAYCPPIFVVRGSTPQLTTLAVRDIDVLVRTRGEPYISSREGQDRTGMRDWG